MVAIDSLKLSLPLEAFTSIDLSKADKVKHEFTTVGGKPIKDRKVVTNIQHGFNRFELNELTDTVQIQVSAKILGDNYYDGISLNTIDQVVNKFNTKWCQICTNNLLTYGDVCTVDPSQNIEVNSLDNSIRSVIQIGSLNSRYKVDAYTRGGNKGFALTKNVSSYKERIIGYAKQLEMLTAKNKKFISDHPNAFNRYSDSTLRIESNLVQKRRIRDSFKVVDTKLGMVLNSSENPNYNVFRSVMKSGRQLDLFDDYYADMNWIGIIKDQGYERILIKAGNDPSVVEQLIKLKMPRRKKSNPAIYQIKLFRKWYAGYTAKDRSISNKHIEKIEFLLKAS